jgi:hypothetical protein
MPLEPWATAHQAATPPYFMPGGCVEQLTDSRKPSHSDVILRSSFAGVFAAIRNVDSTHHRQAAIPSTSPHQQDGRHDKRSARAAKAVAVSSCAKSDAKSEKACQHAGLRVQECCSCSHCWPAQLTQDTTCNDPQIMRLAVLPRKSVVCLGSGL